ncbi:hypothetical protein SESBI_24947 [Sesbania bispinosa]|nr:hypothetical protein SESBI_24947 [Sesbania bispinosa]
MDLIHLNPKMIDLIGECKVEEEISPKGLCNTTEEPIKTIDKCNSTRESINISKGKVWKELKPPRVLEV